MKMTTIKHPYHIKCKRGCGGNGTLIHGRLEYKKVQLLWKALLVASGKGKAYTHQPGISFLGICPKENKIHVHKKTGT